MLLLLVVVVVLFVLFGCARVLIGAKLVSWAHVKVYIVSLSRHFLQHSENFSRRKVFFLRTIFATVITNYAFKICATATVVFGCTISSAIFTKSSIFIQQSFGFVKFQLKSKFQLQLQFWSFFIVFRLNSQWQCWIFVGNF